ncbi:MAG: mycofactocin precursor MftA [Acidimicrobiales bacterium]
MSETTIEATSGSTDADETDELEAVEEELLVEEVSIDGMCGVY